MLHRRHPDRQAVAYKRRLSLLAMAVLLLACLTEGAVVPEVPVRTPEEISAAREYFVLARESERAGEAVSALGWYRLAFFHDAGSRDLCFLFLEKLRDAGEVDTAVATARACVALVKDSTRLTFAEHKLLGEVALRADDENTALFHYRAAYAKNDQDGDVLFVLSGLLEARGEWNAYAATVERLLPRLDYPPRLMERLARAYARLDRPEGIVPALRGAWDETGQANYGRALAGYYDTKGLHQSLLPVAKRLAALEPSKENAWLLARAYAAADRPDQALTVTEILLREEPENPGVRMLHTTLLFERGRYREAYKGATRLAKEFPNEAAYHFLAGSAALELGKRGARESLEKALALAPFSPDFRARLAYLEYAEYGKGRRAREGLQAAASRATARIAYGTDDSLESDRERALFLEGLAHARLARELEPRGVWERASVFSDSAAARRERENALTRFDAVLARNSGHRAALFEAGTLRERLGDRARAKERLRDLVARDSSHALAMNYLAYTLIEEVGDGRDSTSRAALTEAGTLLERALNLDPENGAFLDSKGWWYFRAGEHDSARIWLERAADAIPGDPAVLEHLAQAYDALDRRDDACIVVRQVRTLDPVRVPFPYCVDRHGSDKGLVKATDKPRDPVSDRDREKSP
jgi:tetratricopeptide (TPR) repeat protein